MSSIFKESTLVSLTTVLLSPNTNSIYGLSESGFFDPIKNVTILFYVALLFTELSVFQLGFTNSGAILSIFTEP